MKDYKEERFHSKNYFLEMPLSYARMCSFEKCTTKTELRNGKSYIIKLYTRL